MIDRFNNNKTPKFHSSFSNLLYFSKKNLSYLKLNKRKNNKNKFDKFTNILEKLDGWFSSINDYGYNLEVALFNGKSLYNTIQRDNINININMNISLNINTNVSMSLNININTNINRGAYICR